MSERDDDARARSRHDRRRRRPFLDFSFMRRALVGCLALALGAPPLGVLLVLRRMSLMGDAMSHAILPGAAIGFLVAGLSLFAMTIGGLIAGLAVALVAGVARASRRCARMRASPPSTSSRSASAC